MKTRKIALLRFTALFLFVALLFTAGFFYAKVSALERASELVEEELDCLSLQLELLQEKNKTYQLNSVSKDFAEERVRYTGEYLEVGIFEVTAYTKECGYPWDDGITFTGVEAVPYRTAAVDPGIIPLGSEILLIDKSGDVVMEAVAQDIGSAVKGKIIDIYVGEGQKAYKAAMDWGRKEMIAVYKK